MRICFITNIYYPYHRGGAEQVVKKTVEGLLLQQHEVIVITATPDKEMIERDGNLTIYRIRPNNIFFYTDASEHSLLARVVWHVINIFNISVASRVKKILQQEEPEVVHTHNLMGLSFLIPGAIRKLHLRHVHTIHDVQLVEPSAIILKQHEHNWRYTGIATRAYTYLMKTLMGRRTSSYRRHIFSSIFIVLGTFFQSPNVWCCAIRSR